MPIKTRVAGVTVRRGVRMTTGKGGDLVGPGKQAFKASLLKSMDVGGESVAVFRVLPHPEAK